MQVLQVGETLLSIFSEPNTQQVNPEVRKCFLAYVPGEQFSYYPLLSTISGSGVWFYYTVQYIDGYSPLYLSLYRSLFYCIISTQQVSKKTMHEININHYLIPLLTNIQ